MRTKSPIIVDLKIPQPVSDDRKKPLAFAHELDYYNKRRRTRDPDAPPPPPPPPPVGSAPPPAPSIHSFPTQIFIAPSGGSGIPFVAHRRVWVNILGGYVPGALYMPVLRQIEISKNGEVRSDVTAGFGIFGWGSGSYSSSFIWEFTREFSTGLVWPTTSTAFEGGTQVIRVRDRYDYGANELWSTWATLTVNWPMDYAVDPLHEPFLVQVPD